MEVQTQSLPLLDRRDTASPWSAAARAARQNLVPGLVVQALMVTTVVSYYWLPTVRETLNVLASWKLAWGYGFSMLSAILAGAVLPELLKIGYFQKGQADAHNRSSLIFNIGFWASQGLSVDLFYRSQAVWFGTTPTMQILLKKVLVDQFVYTPLFAAPFAVTCYDWYRHGRPTDLWSVSFYRNRVIPTLLANWAVWIPIVTTVYCLPSALQIPLFSLALTFWSLMLACITVDK